MPETDHHEAFEEKHFTPSELAKLWHVSPDTIRRVLAGEAARVVRNKIVADQGTNHSRVFGFFEKNSQNTSNVFQENILDGSFKNSLQGADCLYGNVSESGKELPGLRNTQNAQCQAEQ